MFQWLLGWLVSVDYGKTGIDYVWRSIGPFSLRICIKGGCEINIWHLLEVDRVMSWIDGLFSVCTKLYVLLTVFWWLLIKLVISSLEQQILAEYEAGLHHEDAALQSTIQNQYEYEVICPVCQRYVWLYVIFKICVFLCCYVCNASVTHHHWVCMWLPMNQSNTHTHTHAHST